MRDRDLWPMQQKLNALLERTAKELGDIYVDVPPESFGDADFVDKGHFSAAGRAALRRRPGAGRARRLPLGLSVAELESAVALSGASA